MKEAVEQEKEVKSQINVDKMQSDESSICHSYSLSLLIIKIGMDISQEHSLNAEDVTCN